MVMAEWKNGRMAEWQNGRMAGMADGMFKMVGMVEWQECRTEWSNGRNGYIRIIYADGMVKMVGMVEWREWRTEWLNGGNCRQNG